MYSTVNRIFHISIRINCNLISEGLLHWQRSRDTTAYLHAINGTGLSFYWSYGVPSTNFPADNTRGNTLKTTAGTGTPARRLHSTVKPINGTQSLLIMTIIRNTQMRYAGTIQYFYCSLKGSVPKHWRSMRTINTQTWGKVVSALN
jgi:hypothetical protein